MKYQSLERNILMLTPGQEIELSIHDINHNGEGVGRWQNIAIFVPHTIPGDTVHAVISKVKKKYAQAKPLLSLIHI